MPLLDRLFGRPESILQLSDVPSINDARITAVGDKGISFRLPDTTSQGRFQSAISERIFGSASIDDKTNPSAINFDDEIKRNDDGTIEIDFRQFGGKKFKGTEEELTSVQGQELFDLVGASIFQQSSAGTLGLDDIKGQKLISTRPQAPQLRSSEALNRSTVSSIQARQRDSLVKPATEVTRPEAALSLSDIETGIDGLDAESRLSLLARILGRT